jgi:hypothetical protein
MLELAVRILAGLLSCRLDVTGGVQVGWLRVKHWTRAAPNATHIHTDGRWQLNQFVRFER